MTSSTLVARVQPALAVIRAGGAVGYPTETLYGLGADASSDDAILRLRSWKGRSDAQPMTILVADAAALEKLGFTLPDEARTLIDAFWPGPLTLVLASTRRFPAGVGRADGAIGVRCASHPLARALAVRLAQEGIVITSTSLNRTGKPPARTHAEARAAIGAGSDAPLLLDAHDLPEPAGVASTVLDLTHAAPVLVREGAVSREALATALGFEPASILEIRE